MLIRRTEDEVVCTPSGNSLSGNRGNMLLTKFLIRRYPELFAENSECAALLARFLSADISTRSKKSILNINFKLILQYYIEMIYFNIDICRINNWNSERWWKTMFKFCCKGYRKE